MEFIKDITKFIKSYNKHPIRNTIALLILIIFGCILAFGTSYCGEKGKQVASPSIEIPKVVEKPKAAPPSTNIPPQEKKEAESPKIEQHTEGNQSPNVINSGGNVNMNYEVHNSKKK